LGDHADAVAGVRIDQIEMNTAAIMLRAIERHWARDEREPEVAPPDRTLRHGLISPRCVIEWQWMH
jgi:hypothetical protein